MQQLGLELLNLSMQIVDNLLVSDNVEVDVDDVADDCGLDVLGAVGVAQCVVRVLKRHGRRADIGNHHSAAVTTQRVLQNAGQLAVTVRDVRGLAVP